MNSGDTILNCQEWQGEILREKGVKNDNNGTETI